MNLKFYVRLCIMLALLSPFAKVFSQKISAETLRQIQLLEDEKASRTPIQRKMDSQLLLALQENKGQRIAGLNLEPARINADAANNLQVDISGTITDNLLARIKSLGGAIIYAAPEYRTVRAQINLSQVEAIAALPEVTFIQPAVLAHIVGNTSPALHKKDGALQRPAALPFAERARRVKKAIKKYLDDHPPIIQPVLQSGNVTSEGDHTHRADDARNTWGHFGEGIKVGVLSDSYNKLGGAPADVAAGELPGTGNPYGNTTPVTVVQDYTSSGNDEGRAMLQIIHDLAPKAQLYYATGDVSEASFTNNIKALRTTYGCDIIIDDIGYYDEPVFQDGIVAQAVNFVTANGALYFSSAGNEGSVARGTAGVFEGDFNDNGSPVFAPTNYTPKAGTVHNFGTATAAVIGNVVSGYGVATLKWDDTLGMSRNDYDLFLIRLDGTVRSRSVNTQSGSQNPYESITLNNNTGDQLVILKTTAAQVKAFSLNTNRATLAYATTGQLYGHAAAVAAFAVAATPIGFSNDGYYPGPFPGVFNANNKVENFSSDGLRRIFFNADSTAVTPGNFLFGTGGGTIRNKPDITAADGVVTTLPASTGLNPFYGTSAAAPHAGAIAALLKSAKPTITTAEMRSLLTSTALDIQSAGFDNVSGSGIVQAYQAMQALNPTPLATLITGNISATEASFSNRNGYIDPGETANLSIQLKNASLADAINVAATLSTSTSGVTVVNKTISYGNIATNGSATNTATPFRIGINSSVPCGTVIKFFLSLSFGGGLSPRVFQFSVTTGTVYTITSTLGSTPPTGAAYTVTTGQQTGYVYQSVTASTCSASQASPGLYASGNRQYDAYKFTNTTTSSQCVSVSLNTTNPYLVNTIAYNSSGFVPTNPNTNYLAEPDAYDYTHTFSFTVAAGQAYTIVVHDIQTVPASNSSYTLTVSPNACTAGPACTAVSLSPSTVARGAVGAPYSQAFAASGGSGYYTYSLSGTLPTGLSFADSTISGTPTQSGSFPITISATDATGCQAAASRSYTLIIAPSTIAATAGTPQTAAVATTFSQQLQARVKDSTNTPLAGVRVIFTAPTSGASGTFTGGFLRDTSITNASGIATADAFTANTITGSYTVTASVAGIAGAANFNLTNSCTGTSNYMVTSSADSGPNTLRELLSISCPTQTSITFDPGISQIVLTSGELLINKGVTITGTGVRNLNISGNNTSRVFNVNAGSNTVAISGLTIQDGNPQSDINFPGGGAMVITSGNVNLTSCFFTNNNSVSSYYGEGGAIDMEGGTVTIDKCTVANNTASNGGGINNYGGTLTITNSTVARNTATNGGAGGGIHTYAATTATSCTVFGNTAASNGGNIAVVNAGTMDIGNTIVAGGIIGAGSTAPDIATANSISSSDYNLIQNTTGATITGTTTHNLTGVNPLLYALGYHSSDMPVVLPRITSPVINAGNPAITSGTDEREYPRVAGSAVDIGAVETLYLLTSNSTSTTQSTSVNSDFRNPIFTVVSERGSRISGVSVTYTAPASGPSGTFSNGATTTSVVSDGIGAAQVQRFTANSTPGNYIVTASASPAVPNINFNFTNNAILPVVFGAVTAQVQDCAVQLQWTTLSETDAKDYTVEYSTDGNTYTSLASLPAKGNSSNTQTYSYIHANPATGTVYYRIRQTDRNGAAIYTKVMAVLNNCSKQLIVVRPNPVKDRLTVQIAGAAKQTLLIYDVAGRKMTEQIVSSGTHELDVKSWSSGIYTLILTQDGKTTYTTKVVKE